MVLTRHPDGQPAASARWELAWLEYRAGRLRDAALAFRQLSTTVGSARLAGLYWAGRTLDQLGEKAAALALYRDVLSRGPHGYYGILAARRVAGEAAGADRGGRQAHRGSAEAPPTRAALPAGAGAGLDRLRRVRDPGAGDARARRRRRTAIGPGRSAGPSPISARPGGASATSAARSGRPWKRGRRDYRRDSGSSTTPSGTPTAFGARRARRGSTRTTSPRSSARSPPTTPAPARGSGRSASCSSCPTPRATSRRTSGAP